METEKLYKILSTIYHTMARKKILFNEDIYLQTLEDFNISKESIEPNLKKMILNFFEEITIDELESNVNYNDIVRKRASKIDDVFEKEMPVMEMESLKENTYSDNDFINRIIQNSRKRF